MDIQNYRGYVEKHRMEILQAERWLWKHPEPGYREFETDKYLARQFEKAGYTITHSQGTTGFWTDIDTGRPGPKVLIFGELDALPCPDHPEAVNGCAHACGHNTQTAALLGLALALKEPGALHGLSGSVRLMAVPAEEALDMEFRRRLPELGIKNPSGKMEFLSRGYMDGVDMVFMIHISPNQDYVFSGYDSNGVITTEVTYTGKSAHSGRPFLGINALNAASLGIQAVNSLRETFAEENQIRVNNVISQGGGAVGTVPGEVKISNQVRGASVKAMLDTLKRVKRAFAAGALATGAQVSFQCLGVTFPLNNNRDLTQVAFDTASQLAPASKIEMHMPRSGGATDMGDMCCVMPALHLHIAGASGIGHGANYRISDPETGCVTNALTLLGMLAAVLEDGARVGKRIVENFTPEYPDIPTFLATRNDLKDKQVGLDYDDRGNPVLHV